MSDVYKTLPEPSKKQKEDWVKDELLNLSKKKKDAWLLLCGIAQSDDSMNLKYHHLCKLTKTAAEKAQNARWSGLHV